MRLTETLSLTEQKDGFWLYDTTRGMNLSRRAKTQDQAFIEALMYYQRRTIGLENELKTIREAVDSFVNTVRPEIEE